MTKRTRRDAAKKDMWVPIGASEFAMIVNQAQERHKQQKPSRTLLKALQRFVRTVQRDRRVAMGREEEDLDVDSLSDDSSCSSLDENSGEKKQKRAVNKVEAWKEDSAAYGVPFVGTSVASIQSDSVIKGQWPTGLLKAYLTKSPLAIEITGETLNSPEYCLSEHGQEHRGKTKLLDAIRKAYLLALAELCTAAVPLCSTGESTKNDEEPRFVSEILSKRLPHLLSLLGEGTNHGKGRSTVVGGCSALVAPVLTILERLALVSTRTARYVARSMEQNVSENVVRFILTPQQQTQRPDRHLQHAMEGDREDKIDYNDTVSFSRLHREKARVAALQLVVTLAAQDDPVVFSCIGSTSGTKERKIRRGILFLSMQRGLQFDNLNNNPGYYRVVARLLRVVCGLLERSSASKRLLSDLFSLEFVQKLVHLSMQAPTLSSKVTFAQVLAGVDSYRRSDCNATKGNATAREQTAIEARRLLFVLIGDTERSPLFYSLAKNRFTQLHEQCIVRPMIQLLDCSDDPDREIRRFVIDITNRVPSLFPVVLRVMTLPDDKHPYALVARLNCLTALLRDGPSASTCFVAAGNARPAVPHHKVDAVKLCLLPLALRRQIFTKFIQSRNHLVAFVSLKLYIIALERCRNFLADNMLPEGDVLHVAEALAQGLPDEAVLIAALSKLDFEKRADAVLFGYICEGIRAYSTVFRGRLVAAKLDWTQLLPDHATVFCQAPEFLQKIILASIRAILPLRENGFSYSSSSSQFLCEILLSTKSVEIFQLSRSVLVDLISRLLSQAGSGGEIGYTRTSWEHEAACWVDGVNHATAADLCRLIHKASLAPLPTAVTFLRVWREVGLKSKSFPGILPSRILSQALCDLPRSSKSFVLLIVQVSTKCLLFDNDSMPLATLIVSKSQEVDASCFGCLVSFARAIVFCDQGKATAKLLLAKQALLSCFSSSSSPLNLFTDTSPNNLSYSLRESNFKNSKANDISALIRYLIGFALMSNPAGHFQVFDLLERLLPQAISASIATSVPSPLSLEAMDCIRKSSSSRNIFLGCLLTSSFLPVQQGTQFTTQSLKAICVENAVSKTLRDHFYFYVLGPFLSADVLVSAILSLLPEGRNADVYARESPERRILRQYLKLAVEKVEWRTVDRLKASKVYSSILPFWLSFTDVHLSDRNLNALSRDCEVLLRLTLSHSFSPFLVRMRSSDIILQQCLLTKLLCNEQQSDLTSNAFMADLIDTDPVRFGPSFLRIHMRRVDDPNYLRIFYLGCLDKEICSVFGCQGFDKPPEAVDSLGAMLDARSRGIYASYSQSNSDLIDCFLSALLAFTGDVKILERVPASSHILLASTLLNENGVAIIHSGDWLRMHKILLLTLKLCRRKTEGPVLAQIALLWCAKALPLALKPSGSDSPATRRHLIQHLEELIEINYSSDKGMVGLEASKHLPSLALSCLGYSMGTSGQQSDRANCLKLVQSLVHCLHNNNPPLSSCESTHFSRTVFEQLTSHSKFTDVLQGESSDFDTSVSLETLRLMKTCLIATNEICFDEMVWRQLLACYDAGVSVKDLIVRRILHLFAAEAPSYILCTTMGQLRWGSAVDFSVEWDWLVDSIDLHRVYATLECFPVNDQLVLKSDQIDEADFLPTEENESKPYSPGFLLPLVLKALADDQEDRKAASESEAGGAVSWKGKVSGLILAQRLCEKGVLALAFVSLCSNDISLRRTAVSVICSLLENVGSDDALGNPYWRDRPQLAMVLNAVQRSLVIRHIRDSDKSKGSERQTNFTVPKLPGFSAVFLARASLAVYRPTDPMFVAVNRAFLRGESDFGAFQDLSRVPVFVSMFCSASSDPEQLKMERRFALQLVMDGMTEEADYRLLMACHCPELLLSSLGRICTFNSTERDDESCVILKTLTKLIQNGGVQAVSHIVDRMGLLSWLRSLLCEVNIAKHGPSQSARVEILLLLAQVVRRAIAILPTKELVAATSGMAQSVLSMTFDPLDVSSDSVGRYSYKSHNQLIKQACAVLSLLQTVLLKNNSARSRECFQPDGFLVETASQFLSTVTAAEEVEAVVCAFCILPINDRAIDGSHVELFWMKILSVTSEILPTLRRLTKVAVLHRFCVMLNQDWTTDMKNRRKLLDLFLTFWTSCALDSELRDAWYQCADQIVSSSIGSISSIVEDTHHDNLATFLFRIHSITCNKS